LVKLRLKRVGKKKQPSYRLVATDSRNARDGKIIENLGHYNPTIHPAVIAFDEEKVLLWLKKGASPSDVVKKVLLKTGIWEKFSGKTEAPVYKSAKAPKKKAQERMKQAQEKREKQQAAAAAPPVETPQAQEPVEAEAQAPETTETATA